MTGYKKQGKTGLKNLQHLQSLQTESEKKEKRGGVDVTGHLKGLSVE